MILMIASVSMGGPGCSFRHHILYIVQGELPEKHPDCAQANIHALWLLRSRFPRIPFIMLTETTNEITAPARMKTVDDDHSIRGMFAVDPETSVGSILHRGGMSRPV
jgi:hypothetical protein